MTNDLPSDAARESWNGRATRSTRGAGLGAIWEDLVGMVLVDPATHAQGGPVTLTLTRCDSLEGSPFLIAGDPEVQLLAETTLALRLLLEQSRPEPADGGAASWTLRANLPEDPVLREGMAGIARSRAAASEPATSRTPLALLKAKAKAQVAGLPQYDGHFDGYGLRRMRRALVTKMGPAARAGELVLHRRGEDGDVIWSLSNKVDTMVPPQYLEPPGLQ